MTIDPRELRQGFGRYATGVAVVTLPTETARHCGVTINSFTSVSLEPPLVSFCISRQSSLRCSFEVGRSFAVNVLSANQADLSRRFAKPSLNNWSNVRYKEDDFGCALLDGALATFSCRRYGIHEGGDHIIVVGKVARFQIDREGEPLVFYAGRYGEFLADSPHPGLVPEEAGLQFVSYWG